VAAAVAAVAAVTAAAAAVRAGNFVILIAIKKAFDIYRRLFHFEFK
jgi:hypothetical protein